MGARDTFTSAISLGGFPLICVMERQVREGEWDNPVIPRLTPGQMTKLFSWLNSGETPKAVKIEGVKPILIPLPSLLAAYATDGAKKGINTDALQISGIRTSITSPASIAATYVPTVRGIGFGGGAYDTTSQGNIETGSCFDLQGGYIPALNLKEFKKLLAFLNDDTQWLGEKFVMSGLYLPNPHVPGEHWYDGDPYSSASYPSSSSYHSSPLSSFWQWSPSPTPTLPWAPSSSAPVDWCSYFIISPNLDTEYSWNGGSGSRTYKVTGFKKTISVPGYSDVTVKGSCFLASSYAYSINSIPPAVATKLRYRITSFVSGNRSAFALLSGCETTATWNSPGVPTYPDLPSSPPLSSFWQSSPSPTPTLPWSPSPTPTPTPHIFPSSSEGVLGCDSCSSHVSKVRYEANGDDTYDVIGVEITVSFLGGSTVLGCTVRLANSRPYSISRIPAGERVYLEYTVSKFISGNHSALVYCYGCAYHIYWQAPAPILPSSSALISSSAVWPPSSSFFLSSAPQSINPSRSMSEVNEERWYAILLRIRWTEAENPSTITLTLESGYGAKNESTPVYVDWADGTVDTVYTKYIKLEHTYSTYFIRDFSQTIAIYGTTFVPIWNSAYPRFTLRRYKTRGANATFDNVLREVEFKERVTDTSYFFTYELDPDNPYSSYDRSSILTAHEVGQNYGDNVVKFPRFMDEQYLTSIKGSDYFCHPTHYTDFGFDANYLCYRCKSLITAPKGFFTFVTQFPSLELLKTAEMTFYQCESIDTCSIPALWEIASTKSIPHYQYMASVPPGKWNTSCATPPVGSSWADT